MITSVLPQKVHSAIAVVYVAAD